MQVNEKQKTTLVDKVLKYFDNNIRGKKFAIWGLAFKPETDDIREAPALYIINELLKNRAHVTAFDPEAMKNVEELLGDKITFAENQYDALADADALLIATEWSVFRNPDFEKMAGLLKNKVIFDGRNLFDLQKMIDLGYYYNSIGRKLID
jgi:UDPglucose 6-dehydrogenase